MDSTSTASACGFTASQHEFPAAPGQPTARLPVRRRNATGRVLKSDREKIRRLISRRGWSLSELARRAGTHQSTLSRYLASEPSPQERLVARLLETLRKR